MFGKKLKKTIKIDGMHCEHCAKRVEEALSGIEDVQKVKVNLKKNQADIILNKDIDDKIIKKAIEDLDFKVTDIL